MVVEIIAESLHFLLVTSLKIYIRNFVETYEVDTTEQTLGQFYYLAGMSHRVVYTAEHNVLERQTTLIRFITSVIDMPRSAGISMARCSGMGECMLIAT